MFRIVAATIYAAWGLAVGKYAARFLNRLASLEPDNSVLPGRRMRTGSGLLYTAFIALCRF